MFKNEILHILKKIYRQIPVSPGLRNHLKDAFYTTFAFALKDTAMYRVWYSAKHGMGDLLYDGLVQRRGSFGRLQQAQPGSIAVHLHLFYLDLIDEFHDYLANMPFDYSLLVSITDGTQKDMVASRFSDLPHLTECVVRVTPNRGRDVAPLIVGFSDLLDRYEFIAHIHSKKSMYTGSEQTEWRNYLLQSLFGSPDTIRHIFAEMIDNDRLGLLYPKPAPNVPYMAFTWLSNRAIGAYLLERLKVRRNAMEYFDFPAGTMFWARTKAIRRLYTSGIRITDFPEEQRQNDGTIAHAVERSLALLVLDEDMDFYEADFSTGTYTVNCGSKNMWQYFNRSEEDLSFVLGFDTISFDIFDTLIVRQLAKPHYLYNLIEADLDKELKKKTQFRRKRLEAEARCRQRLKEGQDCSLQDIYKELAALTGWPKSLCQRLAEQETAAELRVCRPRPTMVRWLNACKEAGRRVILVSDMYLDKSSLEQLLQKCGVSGYDALYLSSETGLRKDNGAIWKDFKEKGLTGRLVHIGDNETSDWQTPIDLGFDGYHILSPVNLFSLTPFGNQLLYRRGILMGLWGAVLLGTILERRFTDPFMMHTGKGRYQLNTFHELGYVLYGPILFTYIVWLIQSTRQDNCRHILFFARDGYFLQPLYQKITDWLGEEAIPSTYFLTSRRSVTMASVRTLEDAFALLDMHYQGSCRKFFQVRFGLEAGDVPGQEISLPSAHDKSIMMDLIRQHEKEILARAAEERAAYQQYIDGLGIDFTAKTATVDMGYAGTIQYYLAKLIKTDNFTGYYFATSDEHRFLDQPEKLHGCFADREAYGAAGFYVYQYQLLLETILTSPDGQLNYFQSENGQPVPVFGDKSVAQTEFASLGEIHQGIEDFCRDVVNTFGRSLLNMELDTSFLDEWIRSAVLDQGLIADELKSIYMIDDPFCNTTNENVLDIYNKGVS